MKNVHSVTYKNARKVEQTTIQMNLSESVTEEGRRATPFDKGVVKRLTPTLKSFTLTDKVALISG